MRHETELTELAVDPAALRAAGNVLLDIASQVRGVDVAVHADTMQAARALGGWRTGDALSWLAQLWQREFAAMIDQLGRLGNGAFEAASNYTAADQAAQTTLGSVDPQHFRGR